MTPTTSGRYRVLGRPREPTELLLVSVGGSENTGAEDGGPPSDLTAEPTFDSVSEPTFDPAYVETTGYEDDLADDVASLAAGNLIDATLAWTDGGPRFSSLDLVAESAFEFYDGVTGIFEAATETWMVAEADNAAMNGRLTRNTDGEPNGALYVFAEQSGARDLFEEFRTGVTPLDPLVRRADEGESVPVELEQPRAVFVLRPIDEPFLVVYVVFRRDGVLAETIRSTYERGAI
ncbi:DUF6663 family protein [Halobellus captivus]|uniref:DUF6663 family protein n=1 Tax=Halobellus captivus TaxID=2592614 RepID=UPI0011A82F8D|nr:DUF6663 family protein [Halobellus captivus]